MSKFLALGHAARGRGGRGHRRSRRKSSAGAGARHAAIGAPADLAIFDLVDGPVEFVDTRNNKRTGTRKLVPVLTVKGGRPFGRPPLPIPFLY